MTDLTTADMGDSASQETPKMSTPTSPRDVASRLAVICADEERHQDAGIILGACDEIDRLTANAKAREGALRRRESALRIAERERDEARAARDRLAASLIEWEEAGHVIGFRGTGALTDMDRAAGLAYLKQHPDPVSDDPGDVMTMGGE